MSLHHHRSFSSRDPSIHNLSNIDSHVSKEINSNSIFINKNDVMSDMINDYICDGNVTHSKTVTNHLKMMHVIYGNHASKSCKSRMDAYLNHKTHSFYKQIINIINCDECGSCRYYVANDNEIAYCNNCHKMMITTDVIMMRDIPPWFDIDNFEWNTKDDGKKEHLLRKIQIDYYTHNGLPFHDNIDKMHAIYGENISKSNQSIINAYYRKIQKIHLSRPAELIMCYACGFSHYHIGYIKYNPPCDKCFGETTLVSDIIIGNIPPWIDIDTFSRDGQQCDYNKIIE
jgi:hypothetical protein